MKLQLGNIDLQATPTRREFLIFIAVVVVAVIGVSRSYFVPNVTALAMLNEQKNTLTEQRDQLANLAHIPQAISKVLGKPQGQMSEVHLSSERDIRLAFDQWTRPAFLKGVKLLGSKLSDVERKGKMLRMNMELQVESSFSGIGRYLERLEIPSTSMSIQSVSITSVSDESSRVQSTIAGSIYAMEP